MGSVSIIKIPEAIWKKRASIGKAALSIIPSAQTILASKGIRGTLREPRLVHLAGKKTFLATHRENGCVFEFDARKTMWSAGNSAERKRISEEIKEGEIVMDFFAGPGDWSIPIAKTRKPEKVIAIEASKESHDSLKKNIALNKVGGMVEARLGKCEKIAPALGMKADRILLGWLPEPAFALEAALDCAKPGTVIHYHALSKENESQALFGRVRKKAEEFGKRLALKRVQRVKSYAPRVNHYDLELEVME